MSNETAELIVGALLWALVWSPLWWPSAIAERRRQRVSRNQTGPAWEQDAPYPECFTEDREDDL